MSSSADAMNVFDRALVRQHRTRAARNFEEADFLFMEGAERLFDRLLDIKRTFDVGLDLGCHAGEMAGVIVGSGRVSDFFQSDLSPAMAERAAMNGARTICVDEEALPINFGSLDLVTSNLSMHWINDLPGALSQIRMALKPDGLFLGSIFGSDTLPELRTVLSEAEIELDGGLSPRISPFADVRDLGALLQRAGFSLPVVDSDVITVRYENPIKLLHDLRGMGETNAVLERRKTPLRRTTLMHALGRYVEQYADKDGRVPATFHILTMTAWAPASNQQQPLRPGSAKSRLADALDGDEISLGEKANPIADSENT
jgi:NADH dehydrogenase [ubiquinone] 1 alpha subcomplex assembly factor 5